jgi:hypothetical protein
MNACNLGKTEEDRVHHDMKAGAAARRLRMAQPSFSRQLR